MMQLHQDMDKFEEKDTKIIVVGPDDKKSFEKFFATNGYEFIGIPDAKNTVLKTYGQEINIFKLGRMPAQVLVDKQGIARFVYYGHSMSDIPSNTDVLKMIEEL